MHLCHCDVRKIVPRQPRAIIHISERLFRSHSTSWCLPPDGGSDLYSQRVLGSSPRPVVIKINESEVKSEGKRTFAPSLWAGLGVAETGKMEKVRAPAPGKELAHLRPAPVPVV